MIGRSAAWLVLLLWLGAATASEIGLTEARIQAEQALVFIPRLAVTFDGGMIEGEEIRQLMRPQLIARLQAGVRLDAAQLQAWARLLAESEMDHLLLVRKATAAGYRPDLLGAREELEARHQGMGDEAFAQTMAMQGVEPDVVVRKLAENQTVNRWLAEQVAAAAEVSDDEMKAYYNKNRDEFTLSAERRLWHILVADRPDLPKERRALLRQNAEDLLARLREGHEFERLARSGSDCASAANGGDLGLVPEERLAKELRAVVSKLEPGEISEVVQSPAGFHILKSGPAVPKVELPFEEVKQRIVRRIQGEKVGEAMEHMRQTARAETQAKVHIPAAGK